MTFENYIKFYSKFVTYFFCPCIFSCGFRRNRRICQRYSFPFILCTTTFEPFRDGVRRTKMRSRFLACLNGRPQEVAMSRRVQTRFMCIEKLLRCVLQTGVLRRHVSFERPLRQTRNHSNAVFVSANNRQRNCPNFGGHKS